MNVPSLIEKTSPAPAEQPGNGSDTLPDASAGDARMDAAVDLARRGFAVFPCRIDGKEPLTRHGCKDASSDIGQIGGWWRVHPEANIGVATGGSSGICVIDVDNKDGKNGSGTLRGLEAGHGALPETYTVRTPTGGFHFYFRCGGGIRNSTGRLGPGLDTRGDGGYVVGAGSSIGGVNYEVVKDLPIAGLPGWVAELLAPPCRKEKPGRRSDSGAMAADSGEKVASALDFLDPDCPYDDWFRIGMALKSWNGCANYQITS